MNQKLTQAPRTNIINSTSWGELQWLSYFKQRLEDMKAKRKPFDLMWDQFEKQETAISYYDNDGSLQVNVPLEQNLIEIYLGRTNGKLVYDIIPDGQTNIEQLQPAKYALNFFLDGNDKENFWKENKQLRHLKALYGTGISFTGLRNYKDYRYKIKEGVEIQSGTDILNEKNFDKIVNETWYFFPKTIHVKDFYIDDRVYGQPDFQKASDCIMKERISFMDFAMRYEGNKACINFDRVVSGIDPDKKNENDNGVEQDDIILYHFFDRITKKYLIVANEDVIVFNGYYLYNDGKLPFATCHHYSNANCIWGRGICEKIGYLKVYKSEILQDILVGAEAGSGIHLLTGNDDEIGQDWEVGGRGVNIWRTTGGAERIQQVNVQPNLGYFSTVLSIIDDLIVQDTGDNLKSPISLETDKVGIAEIMEANKVVRQSTVDENYNIYLDESLTMVLQRIQDFAPSLLSQKVLDSDGVTLKTIFPSIRIDGYKIEKEDGKQIITENIGKYGYFELKPGVVKGIGVKVITSSTNSMLPILERQKVTEYINNISQLAQLGQLDPSIIEKIKETLKIDELLGWIGDAYGYDTKLKANTDKDKISIKNNEKVQKMKQELENLSPNTMGNEISIPTPGIPQEATQNPIEQQMEVGVGQTPSAVL